MRNLIHFVHTSIDGRIQGPNGEFDWPEMGPELSAYSLEMNDALDTLVFGRRVWEMMAAYWPTADQVSDDAHSRAYAPRWRATDKVVVSRTLERVDVERTTLIRDDVLAEIAALKERPGKDIVLMGGAALAGSLAAAGLIDEVRVCVHPVVLGGPHQLLASGGRLAFDFVGTRVFDGRVVESTYRAR
ncbi:dihydrofolate reductase family protein [Pseudonocardia kujensis]|uniref:dihydrofolate reductase family protein n=1 Tax=Pseudonocardia kujensis TaxID=1128675 RepID=UPI001E4691D7|nr:dihydrofolate reductase family protein [Pseudonocardia kujensis]MCE0765644.1 dihydrofolate reductase family protein [Pseudonocardia kujensis]